MIGIKSINIHNLSIWVEQAKTQSSQGKVIERIPPLAIVDPSLFAVHISCESGENYSLGDTDCVFPFMSVIKPFSLLYLLEQFGAKQVLQWVGVKPSDTPFNSLTQLIADNGYPRNSMINSGAITLADKLPGKDGNECTQFFCTWLNELAGTQLYIDVDILASLRANRSQINIDITNYLYETGNLKNSELALDIYEQICCISGRVADLAKLGKVLACQSEIINHQHRHIVNAVMLTCGLYEASPEYAVKIGLPMKSGIGGGLIAIVPNQGAMPSAIASYSPALDSVGNPVAGLALMEMLSQNLQLSIFC
ncbi:MULTISPECIES: glutaminase [unclassified Anabaena]|uniref:glutaminase n=1 Tax=unclassified Anabaena TaxID=2619674 RepID=UPI001447B677|nr:MULTISPECIES: glutaminase [unclassified Anabaena]MTJ06219.1 glutaminase [Anabaena sp. UHCC 0204]MTJ54691.1 glutaminase [Anabaena sp. UHCC 0253]